MSELKPQDISLIRKAVAKEIERTFGDRGTLSGDAALLINVPAARNDLVARILSQIEDELDA